MAKGSQVRAQPGQFIDCISKSRTLGLVWCHTFVIPALRRLKLEDCCEFETSQGFIASSRPAWRTQQGPVSRKPQSINQSISKIKGKAVAQWESTGFNPQYYTTKRKVMQHEHFHNSFPDFLSSQVSHKYITNFL